MKKILILFTLFFSVLLYSQSNGITYQAILYKPNGDVMPGYNNSTVPLASENVCLQFTIVDATSQNEYIETIAVTTDQYGMVNLIIGTGNQTGGYAASFATVDWTSTQKRLRIGLNVDGQCSNFEEISNQPFSIVPYAYSSAYATNAVNVTGIVPIANGGTNASTVVGAKTNLGLDLVDNTSDLAKPISVATQAALNAKENAVNKSTDVTLADVSNTKFPTELAVKTYVDNQIATGTAANVSGIVAIANGGTGSSVQNFVDLTTNQAVAGEKTFGSNTAVNANLDVNGVVSSPVVMVENGTFQTGTWGDNQWQSFTATSSGVLRLISIFGNGAIGDRNGTLNIFSGTGTTGAQLYSGSVALPPFSGWYDLNISSNVTVVSGSVYTFQILDPNPVVSPGGMVASENNLYPQGDYFSSVYGANSNYDLTFKAWVSTVVGGNITASGTVTAGAVTYPNTHGSANQVLTSNGSGTLTWSTPINSASSLTGTLAIANGGTGSSVQNFVDLTNNQSIAGTKLFNSDIVVNGLTIGRGTGQNDQNTALGSGALNSSNANGTRNTAVGALALSNYVGNSFDNNTGVGYFNMIGLTTGGGNTSVGAETMFNVASGSNNTGIGNQSLISTSGNNNVGVGTRSGDGLITGSNNTFLGTQARTTNAGASISNATALGYGAIVTTDNTIQLGDTNVSNVMTSGKLTTGNITLPNTDGTTGQVLTTNGLGIVAWSSPATITISPINGNSDVNGAIINNGALSLTPADATNGGIVTTGNQTFAGSKTFNSNISVNGLTVGLGANQSQTTNTAIGNGALANPLTSDYATAVGYNALNKNTTNAFGNSAFGANALGNNETGQRNTAVGESSLSNNVGGESNTAVGEYSLSQVVSGTNNTAIGTFALSQNIGSYNTAIGAGANVFSGNLTNATAIGYGAIVTDNNKIQLGNSSVNNVNTYGSITANAEISSEITTSFTISFSNAEQYKGKVLVCNPNAPISITFGNDLPTGFNCMVLQKSTDSNTVTFIGGSGVTMRNRNNYTATAGSFAIATIVNIGGGIIVTAGDMQ